MNLATMLPLRTLTGSQLALGQAVSYRGYVLGTIVEIPTADAVWVHRTDDPADVCVWYPTRDLELSTPEELANAGRMFLNRQYREYREATR